MKMKLPQWVKHDLLVTLRSLELIRWCHYEDKKNMYRERAILILMQNEQVRKGSR